MDDKIIAGGYYEYFNGDTIQVVQVISEGIDTSTKESIVIYRHKNPNTMEYEYFSRSKKDFFSKIDKEKYPNTTQETKFKYLQKASSIVISVTDF